MGQGGETGLSGRGAQTGLLVAAAVAPGTFEPSLVPRSPVDQGVVTGLATTLSYLLTVSTQDTIEAVASTFAPRMPGASAQSRQRAAVALLDLAVIPVGQAVQRAVRHHPGEPVLRGMARQVAWRTTVTGIGGALFALVQEGTRRLDDTLGADGRLANFPIAVPAGFALGWAVETRLKQRLPEEPHFPDAPSADPVRAAAISVGVTGALSLVAHGEQLLADATGSILSRWLPGPAQRWRPAGHLLCLGGLAFGGSALWRWAMHKVEAGAMVIEPILDDVAAHRWLGPTVSGGRDSLVPWGTLGRHGRRHAALYVRPQQPPDRVEGLPDLSIATVMGEPAKATPIQVYVGLDSAPTARERVDLALAEMDRTEAWDRSVLMLVSPTGTGYVNYCATAAAQYLTRGDIATVTLQYSKRPSPLSLFKIKDAREQNRLLWLRISSRLRDRNGPRPLVVLFGESLGAHTSQDVLMHWGTLGPQALGIDRALWIGTPYGSGWMHQVTGPARPDVDPDLIATVNDFGQIEAMPPDRRARLRYVMVSHDNDGVVKFGADLIASRPAWLSPERQTLELVPGASPRGISARLRWRPVTTFLQTLVDMKNAQIPGAYRSWAHDYRPDLTRFVAEVFALPASEEQLRRVEKALEERESIRARILSAESLEALQEPQQA
jgi:uncharacterized membrane protein